MLQLLSCKYLITMEGDMLVDGAIAIENGEIIDVGREQDLITRYTADIHEDYPNHVIMPGLINCHMHLDLSFFKDFAQDPVRPKGNRVNFVDWLMSCIEYKKKVSASQVKLAVEWGIDECIQAGTTCVADMSSYEGIFRTLEQKNMRAVIFPEILCIDNDVSKGLFESALAIIEKYIDDDSDLIHVGAGPYSPYTLSRNLLRIMSQYSRSSDIPIMMHVAESFSEMEFFHNSKGDIASKLFPQSAWEDLPPELQRTPVQHLANIGFLAASPLLVGCTQVTNQDLASIAQSGSKIIITPRSHENLGQGVVPYKEIKARHIFTGLGTDGIPSVDTLSLWDEMRAFVRQHENTLPLTGHEVLSMVTTRAAATLGLSEQIGSIAKGKRADLILLDCSDIQPEGDFAMNLIKAINNYHVKSVMINGQNVKSMN